MSKDALKIGLKILKTIHAMNLEAKAYFVKRANEPTVVLLDETRDPNVQAGDVRVIPPLRALTCVRDRVRRKRSVQSITGLTGNSSRPDARPTSIGK